MQPHTGGGSVNAVQNLDATWALVAGANRAYDRVTPIRSAYALGGTMSDTTLGGVWAIMP